MPAPLIDPNGSLPEKNIIVNPYINKKLGYYIVDGFEFDSKIRAGLHSVKVNKPVQWIFNNKEFRSHDWSVEPSETLDQLYDARAFDLRVKYDYLILSFSGGSDSWNIYKAFQRQGLHIDEVIVNTMSKASKGLVTDTSTKAFNAHESEHVRNTVPRLNEIQKEMPVTKITVTDQSDYLFESLEAAGDASWVLEKREGLNPAGITRFNYLHFMEVRKRFDKDKKIGLIVGIEKPRTLVHQGRFFVRFADRSTNMITVAEHLKDYPNSTVEFFYWSPDCVPLLIKQAHVVKKYLEANPSMQVHFNSENSTGKVYRLLHEPLLRNLLYSTWDQRWFQAEKAVLDWDSEFDQWFRVGYQDTKAYQVWMEGLKYVADNLKPFLRYVEDPDNDIWNTSVMNSFIDRGDELVGQRPDGLAPVLHNYEVGRMKVTGPGVNTFMR